VQIHHSMLCAQLFILLHMFTACLVYLLFLKLFYQVIQLVGPWSDY